MKNIILKLTFALFLLLPSCGDVEDATFDASIPADMCQENWVCWNPSSPEHGKSCSSKCFEKGDNTKYCYIDTKCI